MSTRLMVAGLVLCTLGAAAFGVRLHRDFSARIASQFDLITTLSEMTIAASEAGAAQQTYDAAGQEGQRGLALASDGLQELAYGATALGPSLRSAEATGLLQTLTGAIKTFEDLDARLRAMTNSQEDRFVRDSVLAEARDTVVLMTTTLRALSASARSRGDLERAALERQGWILGGGVTVLWVLGLGVLARRASAPPSPTASTGASPLPSPTKIEPASPSGSHEAGVGSSLDLVGAAAICTELSRLSSADDLPTLLARMAIVLDGSGVVLWIGRGEELFAVAAHGYDARVLARLGPIGRDDNNATASAWRSGQLEIVRGDSASNGAIVAPLWYRARCGGVLAVELRRGGESEQAAAAVIAMFAAQLATVLSPTVPVTLSAPAGSGTEPPLATSV